MKEPASAGVLPIQRLRTLIAEGQLGGDAIEERQLQPNSLDLRVGSVGHKVRCSFLPTTRSMRECLGQFQLTEFSLAGGYVLDCNSIYVIPLKERLDLQAGLRGRANPKSTTGRLDVLARLLTEQTTAFEEVRDAYKGSLWVEVVPKSFPILVREGDALVQLRILFGEDIALSDRQLRERLSSGDLVKTINGQLGYPTQVSEGLSLTVGLSSSRRGGLIGYRARRIAPIVDFRRNDHAVRLFWDNIYDDGKRQVVLEPQDFYIFRSRELISVPSDLCAEMVPYDAESGELRTHYAGFFDSGFGCSRAGARAILEMRNHDVPFLLQEGQRVFRLRYYRSTETPDTLYGDALASNYQNQDLRLPRQFNPTKASRTGRTDASLFDRPH